MSEIPEVVIGEKDGVPIIRRVMTADQIVERVQLNVEVTATKIAARAASIRASLNGHSNGHGSLPVEMRP